MSDLPDVYVGLSDQMGRKLLSSLTYPTTLTFKGKDRTDVPEDEWIVAVEARPNEGRIGKVDPGGEEISQETVTSLLDALAIKNVVGGPVVMDDAVQAIIELFDQPLKGETIDLPNGTSKPIMDLTEAELNALEAQGDLRSANGLGKLWKKIKDAVKKAWNTFKNNLARFIEKYFRFTVQETRVTLKKQPTMSAGVPIRFKNMLLDVAMTMECCIKIKSWRCATVNSPKAEIESSSFLYEIKQEKMKLVGTPRAENMTLNIHVSLFGFTFTFKVDVASIVNKFVSKPQDLLDLSKADIKIDLLNRKMKPETVSFFNGAGYAEARVAGSFVPIKAI